MFLPGVVRRYTPVKPCRDFSQTGEAAYLLHSLPGSPYGMKRARLLTIPDTQSSSVQSLSVVRMVLGLLVAFESTLRPPDCMFAA